MSDNLILIDDRKQPIKEVRPSDLDSNERYYLWSGKSNVPTFPMVRGSEIADRIQKLKKVNPANWGSKAEIQVQRVTGYIKGQWGCTI